MMISEKIANQSTDNVYSMHEYRTTSLQKSLKSSDRVSADTTNGGDGGGNDMEKRVTILETQLTNVNQNITDIKTDIRELRTSAKNNFLWLLGTIVALYAFIGVGFFNMDGRVDRLGENVISLQGDVKRIDSDVKDLKADVKELKYDVNYIKGTMEKIASNVAKLANDNNKERK